MLFAYLGKGSLAETARACLQAGFRAYRTPSAMCPAASLMPASRWKDRGRLP
jgi:hypothetical protein